MLDCNSVHTPEYGPELSVEQPEEKLLGSPDAKLYQATVGSVFHLAQVMRYDIPGMLCGQLTDQGMQQASDGTHDHCQTLTTTTSIRMHISRARRIWTFSTYVYTIEVN